MSNLLIIFARNPEIGKTKTRLAAKIGDAAALAIYYKLVNHTQQITAELPCDKAVFYADFVDREDSWDNSKYQKHLQSGSDLGERMFNAIEAGLKMGYQNVVLIGTDIYELTSEIIIDAFQKLEMHDVVIGPAKDGGYYLIGMKQPHRSLFENMTWSHSNVFQDTLMRILKADLNLDQTILLNDIDEPADLLGTDLEEVLGND